MQFALAFAAAVANALSSVLQRKAARKEPDRKSLQPALIWDLLHRRAWLGGILAVIAGFLLQATALRFGSLTVVQPVLVCELPLTLVIAGPILHSRLSGREWMAILGLALGLGLLLFSSAPSPAHRMPSNSGWLLGGLVTAGAVAALVCAGRFTGGTARAALFGIAAGTSFGLTAALMKGAMTGFSRGFVTGLETWETYAMILAGIAAMFILQSALQAGRLAAAQPGITISDPLVSGVWGVLGFGEQIRTGVAVAGEVVGAAMIVAGILVLAAATRERDNASGGEGERKESG